MKHTPFGPPVDIHPLGCRCRACARPAPSDRPTSSWATRATWWLVGVAVGLLLADLHAIAPGGPRVLALVFPA